MAFSDKLTIIIAADARGAITELQKVGASADRELGRATSKADQWGKRFTSVGVGMIGAAGLASAGLFKLGDAASDLAESQNKVDVVFGKSAGEIRKWAESSDTSLGLSEKGALDAAGTFGNLFTQLNIGGTQASSMSEEMVGLAADFASFHNADISEVLLAQTAAFRGEFDAVQRFVPTINAAAVEQKALALGLASSTDEIDAQDKAVATHALLLEGAGKAVGDFARTSDGAANQQRIFRAELENMKASVGEGVLPVMTNLLHVATGVSGAFNHLDDNSKKLVGTVATVGVIGVGAIGGLSLLSGAVIKASNNLSDAKGGFDAFRVGLRGIETGFGGASANRIGTFVNRLGGLKTVGPLAAAGIAVAAVASHQFAQGAEENRKQVNDFFDALQTGGEKAQRVNSILTRVAKDGLSVWDVEANNAVEAQRRLNDEMSSSDHTIQEAAAAQKKYADLLASGTATEKELAAARSDVVDASKENEEVQGAVNDAVAEGTETASTNTEATHENADAKKAQADAAEEAKKQIEELAKAELAEVDQIQDSAEAQIAYQDTIADTTEKVVELGKSHFKTGAEEQAAIRGVEGAFLQQGNAAVAAYEKAKGGALSASEKNAVLRGEYQKLIDQLAPNSPLRVFLQGLIDKLNEAATTRTAHLNVEIRAPGGAGVHLGGTGTVNVFDEGGTVPGPKGSAQLAIVHGGETVVPTHNPAEMEKFARRGTARTTTTGRRAAAADEIGDRAERADVVHIHHHTHHWTVNVPRGTHGAKVGQEIFESLKEYERSSGPLKLRVKS